MTADLYEKIRLLKLRQGLHPDTYGIDVIDVVRSLRVPVEFLDFSLRDIRCVAIPTPFGHHDIILLSNRRTADERNFDCAHAMMHLALHNNVKRGIFVCVAGIEETEWVCEADEAVAEYCVPVNSLLQVLKKVCERNKRFSRSNYFAFCPETLVKPPLSVKIHQ